jgi:serine/threonine protein kinase/tetratricopeptide (TPR) repeat protein
VPGDPNKTRQKHPLRAIFDWFTGPAAGLPPSPLDSKVRQTPKRLGHYVIERTLGHGGMGVVYAARDEKLHRTVAVKTMTAVAADEPARQRFWREARAAASVSHPNVCQIHEIGEDDGVLFIAMELLEGTPLSERLSGGPMSVTETVKVGLGILSALAALHARGLVHRDLKPSNVFLTPHGIKVLDFGLARPSAAADHDTSPALTREGAVLGTPRYMSPEQALGQPVDARTDLFAAGALLYEMLAGRPAFTGNTVIAVLHATIYEEPAALSGTPAVAAIDRVIRRALAKKPADRPASADAMADELQDVHTAEADAAAVAQPLTRLVVLPFRNLRPDPDTDFLAFSLADAITSSLSGVSSLVVRSSLVAARYAGDTPDLKTLASEAGVDRVVMGTLLRAGDELRAVAQLVEAPAGTLIASHTVQMPLGDLFQLQDELARRIVDALALPLGAATGSAPDAPRNARAYELYLRGNELARSYARLADARDLYERAVALDATFAPAWAQLGRCYRVIGKYLDGPGDSQQKAEDAFRRALDLSPRLTLAHKVYAGLEAEIGHGERALVRLIGEGTRHGNDPELFAGLVHACRYCGLFEESMAAHAEARRLDPGVPTSHLSTLLMMDDIDRLVGATEAMEGAEDGVFATGLGLAGRLDDARAAVARMGEKSNLPAVKLWQSHLSNFVDGNGRAMLQTLEQMAGLPIFNDPEVLFQEAWMLCAVGEHKDAMRFLDRAVGRGYYPASTLASSAHFDPLRGTPAFAAVLNDATAGRARALTAFAAAGGARLLGR